MTSPTTVVTNIAHEEFERPSAGKMNCLPDAASFHFCSSST